MKDLQLNTDNDLQFVGQDLVVGDADTQIVATILAASTGELKESPLLGADARRMIGGTPDPFWVGRVKAMLKENHIEVKEIQINNDNIEIAIK